MPPRAGSAPPEPTPPGAEIDEDDQGPFLGPAARDLAEAPLPAASAGRFRMNKNERTFLKEELLTRPDVVCVWHHPFKLRLTNDQWYEVDFLVQLATGHLELFETKVEWLVRVKSGEGEGEEKSKRGHDDSRTKVKTAAALYPFPITIASRRPKKRGGGWHYERVEPGGLPLVGWKGFHGQPQP